MVVFGDGKNDIEMFEEADYSCAVENAAPELIKCADEVIHISVPQYINQRKINLFFEIFLKSKKWLKYRKK